MYDSEDSEEYDPLEMARTACVANYDFDVPEGMECMTYTRRRLDRKRGGHGPHVSECVMCHVK